MAEPVNDASQLPDEHTILVEVAYAQPQRQEVLRLRVPLGATAIEAARRSGLADCFGNVDLEVATLGIFGRIVPHGQELRDGDRVEIYRPLTADPKAVRRARAARVEARRKRK